MTGVRAHPKRPPFVNPFPPSASVDFVDFVDFASEIESEPELLAPLGTLGQRQPELRRLQAALIPQPVVGVEDVEHFPKGRCRAVAESENLADAQIGALFR